jgi:uncharacterized membrane protein
MKYKSIILPLALFSLFSILLCVTRMIVVGNLRYSFLNWNLFLAWVPFALSIVVSFLFAKKKRFKLSILLGGLMWLLFLPNTVYVLTDMIHLTVKDFVPLWFDLVLILSYAMNSLFLGIMSLLLIHRLAQKMWGKFIGWLFVNAVVFLSSYGVYLGRFFRWNSWDLWSNPKNLFESVSFTLLDPLSNSRTLVFTLLFFCLSMIIYMFFYSIEELKPREK